MKSHLSDAEIEEVTRPLTQGAARCKYFKKLGCLVNTKPNGQPLIGRAEYEATITAKRNRQQMTGPPAANVVTPDWDALRRAGGRKAKAA